MPDPIREIEKIIDAYHKNASALKHKRSTALLYALRIFEDACRLGGTTEIGIGGDSLDHTLLIREQLDSLRTSVNWIFDECDYDPNEPIDYIILTNQREQLMQNYLANHITANAELSFISKKGIRVRSNPIPVISLSTFISAYKSKQSLSEFFEYIQFCAFLTSEQQYFDSYGYETINYAGYTFELPALIKNRKIVTGTIVLVEAERNTKSVVGWVNRRSKNWCSVKPLIFQY